MARWREDRLNQLDDALRRSEARRDWAQAEFASIDFQCRTLRSAIAILHDLENPRGTDVLDIIQAGL